MSTTLGFVQREPGPGVAVLEEGQVDAPVVDEEHAVREPPVHLLQDRAERAAPRCRSPASSWWARTDSGRIGRPGSGRISVLKASPSRMTPPRIGTMPTEMIGSLPGVEPARLEVERPVDRDVPTWRGEEHAGPGALSRPGTGRRPCPARSRWPAASP